jgi:hypothetical protein
MWFRILTFAGVTLWLVGWAYSAEPTAQARAAIALAGVKVPADCPCKNYPWSKDCKCDETGECLCGSKCPCPCGCGKTGKCECGKPEKKPKGKKSPGEYAVHNFDGIQNHWVKAVDGCFLFYDGEGKLLWWSNPAQTRIRFLDHASWTWGPEEPYPSEEELNRRRMAAQMVRPVFQPVPQFRPVFQPGNCPGGVCNH